MTREEKAKQIVEEMARRGFIVQDQNVILFAAEHLTAALEAAKEEGRREERAKSVRYREALQFIADKCSLSSDPVAWRVAWRALKDQP